MSGNFQQNGLVLRSGGAPPNSAALDVNQTTGQHATPRGIQDADGTIGLTLQNGIRSAATATDLGDTFQYAIDNCVTIPRQKSAMLPIVNQELEGDKVSVYNSTAHPKYPLLAFDSRTRRACI